MIIFAVGDKGLHPHIELPALGAGGFIACSAEDGRHGLLRQPHRRVALRTGAGPHGEQHALEHPLSALHPFPGSEARPWRTPQEVLRAHIQQVCGRISLRWSLPQAEICSRRICHQNDNTNP